MQRVDVIDKSLLVNDHNSVLCKENKLRMRDVELSYPSEPPRLVLSDWERLFVLSVRQMRA